MKLYVGVTDNDWYHFLSQLADVDEVNFRQPVTFAQLRKSARVLTLDARPSGLVTFNHGP
jgi:hypothetical protein